MFCNTSSRKYILEVCGQKYHLPMGGRGSGERKKKRRRKENKDNCVLSSLAGCGNGEKRAGLTVTAGRSGSWDGVGWRVEQGCHRGVPPSRTPPSATRSHVIKPFTFLVRRHKYFLSSPAVKNGAWGVGVGLG